MTRKQAEVILKAYNELLKDGTQKEAIKALKDVIIESMVNTTPIIYPYSSSNKPIVTYTSSASDI